LTAGASEVIVIERHQPKPEPVGAQEPEIPEIAFEQKPENRIVVPSRLGRAHAFVRQTSQALREGKVYDRGLLFPKAPALNIRISRLQVPRALRIMDALVKASEARGYAPQLPDEGIGLSVTVLGEKFSVSLMELTKKHERPPTEWERRWMADEPTRTNPYELVPCGDFALTISDAYYDVYQMKDATKKPLEDGLNQFVIRLIRDALKDKHFRAERERRRLEQAERERVSAEEERLQQEEEKVKQWNDWMANWRRAKEVREFAAAIRQVRGPVEAESNVERWLEWAEAYAKSIDPLSPIPANKTR
jgi:hypothetical protein